MADAELRRLKLALDEKVYRKGTKDFNKTFCRLRLIVLIAVTTGMRMSEIFGLMWSDAMYNEGLLAVRAKLKGGKMRYVPMSPELADELRRFMPQPANNVLISQEITTRGSFLRRRTLRASGNEMWKLLEPIGEKEPVG